MEDQKPTTNVLRVKICVTTTLIVWAAIIGFVVGRHSKTPTIIIGERVNGEIRVLEIKDNILKVFDSNSQSENAESSIDIVENF